MGNQNIKENWIECVGLLVSATDMDEGKRRRKDHRLICQNPFGDFMLELSVCKS